MNIMDLTNARIHHKRQTPFITDLFCDDIWGDNGEDCATIHIQPSKDTWHLQYTRTQSGIPYPFAKHTSIVIDTYEKTLTDEQLFTYIMMHNLQDQFMHYTKDITK